MTQKERLAFLLTEADKEAQNKAVTDYNEAIADNADFLLANGVILPPVAIGQKVYIIGWDDSIEDFTVKDVAYAEDEFGEYYYRFRATMGKSDIHFTGIYIGETVFLTREDAERALKGE